jgi:hypothetical protein
MKHCNTTSIRKIPRQGILNGRSTARTLGVVIIVADLIEAQHQPQEMIFLSGAFDVREYDKIKAGQIEILGFHIAQGSLSCVETSR